MSGNSASWTPERRAAQAAFMRRRNTEPVFIGAANKARTEWTPERRAAKSAQMKALNADPQFHAAKCNGIARRKPRGLQIPDRVHPLVRGLFLRINEEQATREDIASRAGIHDSTLDNWRRRFMPRVDLLDAALNALDLELAIVPIGSRDRDGFLNRKQGRK